MADWLELEPLETGSSCFTEAAELSPVGRTEPSDQERTSGY